MYLKNYGIKIREMRKSNIQHFLIQNLTLKTLQEFESNKINWKTKNLLIYPKIFEIYNL